MNLVAPEQSFIAKVGASLAAGTFVRLVLSAPRQPDGPERVLGRLIELHGQPCLSLTQRYARRDVTRNLPQAEVTAWLQTQVPGQFRNARLGTTTRDWQWSLNAAGEARLVGHKPTQTQPPARTHDQKTEGWLEARARDWLTGLDVMNASGQVRASLADKYRQINHYLELVSHLGRECGWPTREAPLRIADMGCGKGYLTFGLWHLLARVWQLPVQVLGVEARADLVARTNALARQISAAGLEFVSGEIRSVPLPPLDAMIALHACNTATDDALLRGVAAGAQLLVVAPCCHQQVRPQLGQPAPLGAVLQHGLMAERLAEWATDGLRALFLAWAGYRVKMLEFVSSEHTPKNLMIAAVRNGPGFTDAAAREKIIALKTFLGVREHGLDEWLAAGGGGKPL